MLRSLFFLFFITITLYGLSDTQTLQRAQKYLQSSNKSELFRAYNDYKNLYLKALVSENEKLRYSALKGIVKSGNKLHIDVSQYAKELQSFQKKPIEKKLKQSKKTKQKIYVTSAHKLKSIRWKNNKLLIYFDKKLHKKQIKYFTLYDAKRKKYKYVFDISGAMLQKSHTLRHQSVDRIKLSQYKADTLRLVFENRKKLHLVYGINNTQLFVSITNIKKEYKQPVASVKKKRILRNKVIVIDAGHGGKDPGALGYRKYREKVVVLAVAKELQRILQSRGYKVYMTRDRDKFIKLRNRTKYANKKKADIFISIHANAYSGKNAHKVHGIECYFLDKSRSSRAKKVAAQENSADMSEMDFYGKEIFLSTLNSHNIVASNKLAIDLQRGALATLRKNYKNVKDAGVRPAPFWVLVGAQMPSVLVEVGFITHPTEAKRLVNKRYQKKMAEGLANGIERYFINN